MINHPTIDEELLAEWESYYVDREWFDRRIPHGPARAPGRGVVPSVRGLMGVAHFSPVGKVLSQFRSRFAKLSARTNQLGHVGIEARRMAAANHTRWLRDNPCECDVCTRAR